MPTQIETLSTGDGLNLAVTNWLPTDQVRAHFVITHGLGEHSGRYTHMAQMLAGTGYAVHAVDLRGHGRSGGPRGHTPGMTSYVHDLNLLIDELAGTVPVFLYGHSLGGLIAIVYALAHQDQLKGLILSAPAIKRRFEVPFYKLILGRLMSAIWPTFTEETGLNSDDLTRLEEVNQAYRDDPLVHSKATARLFTAATDAGPEALQRAVELQLPTAVIQGGKDMVVAAEASRKFFERLRSQDKRWIFIPDSYHEVHNEADGDKVIRTIQEWVSNHL